jgi:chromate transporter
MTSIAINDMVLLFANLLALSLLTNGNVVSAIPDLRRMMVNDMGLLSDLQFSSSIAIANAAPGPTVLLVAVVGFQAAGIAGAAVTLFSVMLPSTTLAYAAARWGHGRRDSRLLRAFKAATAPIVIALPFASGWSLASHAPAWSHLAITAAVALLVWRTRTHVLLLIAMGAGAGAMGWI